MARTKQTVRIAEEDDSSQPSRLRRGIPPYVPNPDFQSQLAKWAKRKLIPEKGINVSELDETPIPQTIENRGVDLSIEEMKEPPVDIGINQWYSLYPSKGLKRPRGPKRARTEAEDSESVAEGSESGDEGSEPEAKDVVQKQADVHEARKEEIQAVKDEILREIAASKGRTRAVISDVEDGIIHDFA
ncbi:hypothetical protein LWI28_017559 [Acer negundo]|uniref:Uncharacterized protein n=1 Tax=Acer negundo TaxID=4023 RepID=A0AAD5IMW7_ACENE|nr:hypothetical protein LWI28_017559 [Acer negundo]